jgi:hypothetical protein
MGLDCVFFAMAQTPSVVRFGVARRGGGRASGVAGMAALGLLTAAADVQSRAGVQQTHA